jgi:type II secretory pathway pseudopilin PulG
MKIQQSGFSLVQTMVAVGLTGVLAMIVMKNQETSTSMSQKNNANQVVTQTTQIVQKLLNDRASCSASLAGKSTGANIDQLIQAQVNPADYNAFIPIGVLVDTTKPLQNGVLVKKMTIINDAGLDYLEVEFNLDPNNKTKMVGAKEIKKRFQLQLAKDVAAGTINTCHSESDNLVQTSAVESCKAMKGTMVSGKCEFMQNLVDNTAMNCGGGASYRMQVVGGKIKLVCTPCTLRKKFIRWVCDDPVRGVNYLNLCYYKSGCAEDASIEFGLEWWEIGPTSASGGDTGNRSNCHEKRRTCPGE